MIFLALAASVVAFYLGTMAGCWLTGKGRESAYLEGAEAGAKFERRRVLKRAFREADADPIPHSPLEQEMVR